MKQKDLVHPVLRIDRTLQSRGNALRQIHTDFYADSKIKFSLDLCIELYLQLYLQLVLDLVDMEKSPHPTNVQRMVNLILLY